RPELRGDPPGRARHGSRRLRDVQAQARRVREGGPQAGEGDRMMPFPRPIDSTLHGVTDYTVGTFLMTGLPRAADIEDTTAGRQIRTAGALHAGYSTITDYPLGAVKLLPYKAHLALDALG